MTTIESVTIDVSDPTAAAVFYTAAFDLSARVGIRAAVSPTTGFRGFMMSLVVSQPSTVDSLIGTALDHGARALKPAAKSLWGYGGVVQAPDGAIWKVATSSRKDTGPATRRIDDIVLLLGVADVKASKRFYIDRGLTVKRSFGGKYVEFDAPDSHVKLALYGRRALAKDAGVSPDGTGSHRIVIDEPVDDARTVRFGHANTMTPRTIQPTPTSQRYAGARLSPESRPHRGALSQRSRPAHPSTGGG